MLRVIYLFISLMIYFLYKGVSGMISKHLLLVKSFYLGSSFFWNFLLHFFKSFCA